MLTLSGPSTHQVHPAAITKGRHLYFSAVVEQNTNLMDNIYRAGRHGRLLLGASIAVLFLWQVAWPPLIISAFCSECLLCNDILIVDKLFPTIAMNIAAVCERYAFPHGHSSSTDECNDRENNAAV
eukprot:scaffold186343_cov20-Prasinocladus_malaysianus.AAC.1